MSEEKNQEVQAPTTDPVVELTTAQKDLEQINAAIAQLKASGSALVTDEITSLEQKAAAITAKIESETITVVQEVEVAERTFVQKYGQAAAHGIEIVLLAVIVAKLLGAM